MNCLKAIIIGQLHYIIQFGQDQQLVTFTSNHSSNNIAMRIWRWGWWKKNPISNQSFGECTKLWESDCRDTLGVKRTNQLFYFFFHCLILTRCIWGENIDLCRNLKYDQNSKSSTKLFCRKLFAEWHPKLQNKCVFIHNAFLFQILIKFYGTKLSLLWTNFWKINKRKENSLNKNASDINNQFHEDLSFFVFFYFLLCIEKNLTVNTLAWLFANLQIRLGKKKISY